MPHSLGDAADTVRGAPSPWANTHPAQPPDGARLRACASCGGYWLDYADGRQSHKAVFGHGAE